MQQCLCRCVSTFCAMSWLSWLSCLGCLYCHDCLGCLVLVVMSWLSYLPWLSWLSCLGCLICLDCLGCLVLIVLVVLVAELWASAEGVGDLWRWPRHPELHFVGGYGHTETRFFLCDVFVVVGKDIELVACEHHSGGKPFGDSLPSEGDMHSVWLRHLANIVNFMLQECPVQNVWRIQGYLLASDIQIYITVLLLPDSCTLGF